MQPTKKLYILTGGSGTGKSTVLEVLRTKGYAVADEPARKAFRENPSLDRNDPQLQVFLAQRRIAEEKVLQGICFVDRSIIDNLAYLEIYNLPVPSELSELIKQSTYEADVFLLDLPPKERFGKAGQTFKTYDESLKEHAVLMRIYTQLGYRLITVPFAPYEQQAEFILAKVKELNDKQV